MAITVIMTLSSSMPLVAAVWPLPTRQVEAFSINCGREPFPSVSAENDPFSSAGKRSAGKFLPAGPQRLTQYF